MAPALAEASRRHSVRPAAPPAVRQAPTSGVRAVSLALPPNAEPAHSFRENYAAAAIWNQGPPPADAAHTHAITTAILRLLERGETPTRLTVAEATGFMLRGWTSIGVSRASNPPAFLASSGPPEGVGSLHGVLHGLLCGIEPVSQAADLAGVPGRGGSGGRSSIGQPGDNW